MIPVISSSLDSVGYDIDASELTVIFKRGNRSYTYYNVPSEVYDGFLASDSKGRYFLENIKGQYEF